MISARHRHPELVSGSNWSPAREAEDWMLNQVQHDGVERGFFAVLQHRIHGLFVPMRQSRSSAASSAPRVGVRPATGNSRDIVNFMNFTSSRNPLLAGKAAV
jgi:hypothetical protein